MDANGLRLWPLLDRAALGLGRTGAHAPLDVALDHACGDPALPALRLARRQAAPAIAPDDAAASAAARAPSAVCDPAGSFAWWDPAAEQVRAGGFATGAAPLPLPPEVPPGVVRPDDLAFGDDDVLYAARNGAVTLTDRRDRWAPARAALADFAARRLAPAPGGGVWALDPQAGRLARLRGRPLRRGGVDPRPDAERFRPEDPNPDPPRLIPLDARLPAGRQGADLAVSAGGRLAVTAWRAGEDAELHLLDGDRLALRFALQGLRRPVSLAWLGEDAVAVIGFEGDRPAPQAFVYEVDAAASISGAARPLGAVHRLLSPWRAGFCKALGARPRYLSGDPASPAPDRLLVLHPLSQARYARRGAARPAPADAGTTGAVWHRVLFDADIPEGTGGRIWAFASDDPTPPPAPGAPGAPDWAPHRLGAAGAGDPPPDMSPAVPPDAPRAAALDPASDPDHRAPAIRGGTPHVLLLQAAGRRVRRLAGQFLHLHVELLGDARATPRIAALRIEGARFSWRDRYLPDLFGETLSGAEAAAPGPATPPDFLDRLLALFEGRATEIEDRISAAWLLTEPNAAPDDALPWLAGWVGVAPEPAEAPRRLRRRLRAAPHTARLHGSIGGLLAALELATGGEVVTGAAVDPLGEAPRPGALALARRGPDAVRALVLGLADARRAGETAFATGGAVTGGEIVAVEGFRLRRTFATLLGVDLGVQADDPLIPGGRRSGNSVVGDALILGEPWAGRLLAALTEATPRGARAAEAFLDGLAHRVLVLVREGPGTRDLGRLRAVAEAEAPAHVAVEVLPVAAPLLVAVTALVGVDTYLTQRPPIPTAALDRSDLGAGDQVRGTGRLDPRADGPAPPPPEAALDGPAEALLGSTFVLSGARSRAFAGARIDRHVFLWE